MDFLSLLSGEAAAALHGLPLEDPERARRLLTAIGERVGPPHVAVPVLEALLLELAEAPDPEMALLNLDRWSASLPSPASTVHLLTEDPRLLADLLSLFGASEYLSDILVRDPWLYSMLREEAAPRTPEQYAALVEASLRSLSRPESRRHALRRIKRREFLRIGWRDLARRAPLTEVAREISDVAEALVRGALQLAEEELAVSFPTARTAVKFSVIGMGKLGARELNYSSDIDLVFVMDSPDLLDEGHRRYAKRLAETLIAILGEDTPEGRCFRVDMRLRPEGRSGALVRSFSAFRQYYDRWAETWERQALIKARAVAGDPELGERFQALVRPVIYRRIQGATLLEDVREMRAAVERKLTESGVMEHHVKEGRGTIRDVEFTVQLLQLLFGADRRSLQVADTWTALERLRDEDLLSTEEFERFREGYRFFREVEHRLQLLHDLPVRLVPTDPRERRRIGRSMGFSGADDFIATYRLRSNEVRKTAEAIQARLGVETASEADDLREALLCADTPSGLETLREELGKRSFPDVKQAAEALARLATGAPHLSHPGHTRRLFADLAPAVLDLCCASADPALALEGLADYADRKLLHRALYQSWLDDPATLHALAAVAGNSPTIMRLVLRYPELSDVVVDPEQVKRHKTADELRAEAEERVFAEADYPHRLSALRRFRNRELVRLATRRAVGPVSAEQETAEWSHVADAVIAAGLRMAVERLYAEGRWPREDAADFAVFALGRLGGCDLHFPSDLDLLYVFGSEHGLTQQQYEALGKALSEALQMPTDEGRAFEIDLRLRPEGRQGFSVTSLEAARRYYGEGGRAETWELQMLTRLRFVTGSERVADEFRRIIEPRVYRDPMAPEWRDQISAMKRRMETERTSDTARDRHLKLGPGGLSDIEFLVQFLQLAHGGAEPDVRVPSTLAAVRALCRHGHLGKEEAESLEHAHGFLTGLRQSLYLLSPDRGTDVLPEDSRLAAALARAAGSDTPERLVGSYREVTEPVRALYLRALGQG